MNLTALDSRLTTTWTMRSRSARTLGTRPGRLRSRRTLRSRNSWLVEAAVSSITSRMSSSDSCHSTRPDSRRETSSTWPISRRQALGLLDDDAEEARALRGRQLRVVVQDLGEGADRGERRAQLVRHGGDELVLHAVELGEALVRRAQLLRGALELLRLLLEAVAVDHDLRGFVQHRAHFVQGQRLLLHHRGEHDVRRGGADHAGELLLDEVHQVRVRPPGSSNARRTHRSPRAGRRSARAG